MASLIERYVYAVAKRMPQNEREDVKRELTSNIYDMLSDEPTEEEITEVLNGLGSPALLASQYQQKQRFLISPAFYEDYIRALKWIVPLVGCVLLAIGLIIGAIEAFEEGASDAGAFAASLISNGISLGVAGAFHALFWTTAGFVIAERTGVRSADGAGEAWTVELLPEVIEEDPSNIPLSESIVELVLTVVFSTAAALVCLDIIPIPLIVKSGDVGIMHLFTSAFLLTCVPVILICCAFGVIECIIKIVKKRWTPALCATVVVGNLVTIGLFIYLAVQPQIFTQEFVSFATEQGWWQITGFKLGSVEAVLSIGDLLIYLIVGGIVIGSVAGCISAIRKTIKARNG